MKYFHETYGYKYAFVLMQIIPRHTAITYDEFLHNCVDVIILIVSFLHQMDSHLCAFLASISVYFGIVLCDMLN